MQGESEPLWRFTDEDRDRLQPLLDRALRVMEYAIRRICEMANTVEDRIEILQGVGEEIADRLREQVLQQVDRGEWAARGINRREDVSITVTVDARAAVTDPNANLLHISILPTERLS